MEKHDLTEITVEEEGVKIHLRRGSASPVLAPAREIPPAAREGAKNIVEIKAPMVGTFYRSPGPDAKPFVEVGNRINEGDVLCIIEAMKLMNEIKSEVKGKIVDILAENGGPVEFGHVMFLVEPS